MGSKAKLYNFKSFLSESVVHFLILFVTNFLAWVYRTGWKFLKNWNPISLPPHILVSENMILFSIQFCKDNNLSWERCVQNKCNETPTIFSSLDCTYLEVNIKEATYVSFKHNNFLGMNIVKIFLPIRALSKVHFGLREPVFTMHGFLG